MDLSELLQQMGQGGVTAQAPEGVDVEGSFDQLAGMLPKEALAGGLAEAFRSDQTPPFASMLGGLFGNSGGSQQASVLNSLLSIAGPMILQQMMGGGRQQQAAVAGGGGGLGDILGSVLGGGGQQQSSGGGLGDILGAVLGGGQQRAAGDGGLGDMLGAVMGGGGGGGALAGILGQMMQGGGLRELTPEEAAQVSPEEVQALAEHAAQQDPSIMDRLSEIYAEHPTLIKTLGSGALMLALSKIAQSQRQ